MKLSKKDVQRGYDILRAFGITSQDWFVVFHFAENKDEHSLRRVNNPQKYLKAIEYVIQQGGKVIQLGRKDHVALPKVENFFDLSDVFDKDPFMNIFLLLSAKLLIASASGPCHLPYVFGKPSLWTNVFPFALVPILKNDRYLPKHWFSNGRYLTPSEIVETGLSHAVYKRNFERSSIEIIDNDEKEIFSAVRDMLKDIQQGFKETNFQKAIYRDRIKYGQVEGGGLISNGSNYRKRMIALK